MIGALVWVSLIALIVLIVWVLSAIDAGVADRNRGYRNSYSWPVSRVYDWAYTHRPKHDRADALIAKNKARYDARVNPGTVEVTVTTSRK